MAEVPRNERPSVPSEGNSHEPSVALMTKPEYSGREWQRVRKIVLARDRHECQIRGPHCRIVADAVDHVIEMSRGGARLDLSNLQAACVSCNTWKRNVNNGRAPSPIVRPRSGWV